MSTITNEQANKQSQIATQQALVDLGAKLALDEKKKQEEKELFKKHKKNIQSFLLMSNERMVSEYNIKYASGAIYDSETTEKIKQIDKENKKYELELYTWENPPDKIRKYDFQQRRDRIETLAGNIAQNINKRNKLIAQCNHYDYPPRFFKIMDSVRFILKNLDVHVKIIEKENEELKLNIQDKDEEIDETTEELEKIEKEKGELIEKLTKRVENVRSICMKRNNTIYYMKIGLAIQLSLLFTISIFGFDIHYDIIFYSILYPIYKMFNAYFIAVKWFFEYFLYYIKYIIYLCSSYIVDNAEL